MKGWIWLEIIVVFHIFFHVPTCLKLKLLAVSPSFLSCFGLVFGGGGMITTTKFWGPGVFIVGVFL